MTDPLQSKVTLQLIPSHWSNILMNSGSTGSLMLVGGIGIASHEGSFGGKAILFDGTAGNYGYLGIPSLGAQDWCMEAWVTLRAMPTATSWPSQWSSFMGLMSYGTYNLGDGCGIYLGSTNVIVQSNDVMYATGPHGLSVGLRKHIAASKQGTTIRIFSGGLKVGEQIMPATSGSGQYFYLGSETGQGAVLNAYVEDMRMTAGDPRYTADFTPPGQFEGPQHTAFRYAPCPRSVSLWHGGGHRIRGRITRLGTPILSKVLLFEKERMLCIDSTLVNADGEYEFRNVDAVAGSYFVASFDPSNPALNMVATDNMIFEVMP